MNRSAKYLVGLTVLGVAAVTAWVVAVGADARQYEKLVRVLPSSVRLYYLNQVFDQPTEACGGCYSRLVGALEALKDNAQDHDVDYGFDYARLIPLLRQGTGYIREPVPQLACNLVLTRRDERVYKAMVQQFQQDAASLRACVVGGSTQLKSLEASEYESTRAALLKVPELSPYIEAVK